MVRPFVIAALLYCCFSGAMAMAESSPATRPSPAAAVDPAGGSLSHSSVSIPWEDVRALLAKASPETAKPPVDFAYSQAEYAVTVDGKELAATANAEIILLVDGWTLVPIGPANSGVVAVTIDAQPATLVVKGEQLFALLKGKGPKKLTLTVSRGITTENGAHQFDLPLLPSALVHLSATLPKNNLSVQASGATALTVAQNGPTTVVTGIFHGETTASVSWHIAPAPAKAQPAEIFATTMTRVDVERASLRCRADIKYEIIHAGVDALRIALPEGINLTSTAGPGVRDSQTVVDGKSRTLVVNFNEPVQGDVVLAVEYSAPLDPAKNASPIVPLLSHPSAAKDVGFVGIEVRDSVEVVPAPVGLQRIDVKELPRGMWDKAASPLLFSYRYDAPGAKLSLALTRNVDLDVLVAMSDICEVSTTYTPDGKSITKMMFVTRNNRKQYMTLRMPEGAQVWSAFVDDHPVTPAKNATGDVLIPLKKSDPEDADEDDSQDPRSYRARREKRRSEEPGVAPMQRARQLRVKSAQASDEAPPDLKPYDVEIVFVTPATKFASRGEVKPALPQSDIPIGHLSWAIFLPADLKVIDTSGNVAEVTRFTLPFRHFGDVAYDLAQRREKGLTKAIDEQKAMQEAAQMLDQAIAEKAKAQGVLPVRIEIPMIGEIHRFEKFLVVDEPPGATLTYTRRQP